MEKAALAYRRHAENLHQDQTEAMEARALVCEGQGAQHRVLDRVGEGRRKKERSRTRQRIQAWVTGVLVTGPGNMPGLVVWGTREKFWVFRTC